MIRSVAAFMFVTVMVAAPVGAQEKIGAGTTLKDALPIATLYASPEPYVGKTIRLDGVVSEVCEMMGCWMALAAADNKDLAVRFKVDDGGPIVFPMSARGKRASAEGVFQKIGADDKDAKEAAGEQKTNSAKAAEFGSRYQVKATGAVIY